MKLVLVDTSIWSLALRKRDKNDKEKKIIERLSELVLDLDSVIIGPIRQEILSGISDKKRFEELKERLSMFEDFPITRRDYEKAAEFHNECRKKGIQGSHTDFLICAVAFDNDFSIMTLDKDFDLYKQQLRKIKLEKLA